MANSGTGFTIQGRGVLIGNRLVAVGGIDVGTGSVVSENDIGDAPGAAITVRGPQCCVEENYVNNAATGISVVAGGDQTLIDGNQITGVSGGGLVIDSAVGGCFVVRNCVGGLSGAVADSIPAGNAYGPLVTVAGSGDISALPTAANPWANFHY